MNLQYANMRQLWGVRRLITIKWLSTSLAYTLFMYSQAVKKEGQALSSSGYISL